MHIPIINFSCFKTNPRKVAQEIFKACKSIGFFYLVNHSIPQQDVEKAFELGENFFKLPIKEKQEYANRENHGYSEMYSEMLDPNHQKQGDHKEGFNIRNFVNGNPFAPLPPLLQNEKEFLCKFSKGCHNTAIQVLKAFSIALEIPEEKGGEGFFTGFHTYDKSSSVLRFLKYPRGGMEEYGEPVRAGAHSDYGTITLLFQKDVPGLEVQASRSQWISAPLIPGAILVNVGDEMEQWTNGLFKSTKHRVVFSPEYSHLDRYSVPYFVQCNDDAVLTPVSSKFVNQMVPTSNVPVLTAGEYLKRKLDASYNYSGKTRLKWNP